MSETFTEWVNYHPLKWVVFLLTEWIKKQTDRRDHVGDLARDIVHDEDWPRYNKIGTLRGYLSDNGACDEALEALEAAWSEYCGGH